MWVDFAVEIFLPFVPCIGWPPGLSDKVEFDDFNLTEREFPMTDDRLPLAELAAKSGDSDFLRAIAESVLQLIMEADVDGLIGAGRTELAELLFGVKPKTGGRVVLNGTEIHPRLPKEAIDCGIALVPEDRKRQGVLLDVDIKGNISMPILERISRFFTVDKKEEKRIAGYYRESIRIKTPTLEQKVKNLSGGNQQKVIVAKWLASEPTLVIFDEPTRGIDVGAKSEIYALVNSLVESGKAVLMISSEMEEVMGMSDRILVLRDGRIVGELERKEFSQETIMGLASQG